MTPSSSVIRAAIRDNSRLNILSFSQKFSHKTHNVYQIKSGQEIPPYIDFDLAVCEKDIKPNVFKITSFYHIPLMVIENSNEDFDKKINETINNKNFFEVVY